MSTATALGIDALRLEMTPGPGITLRRPGLVLVLPDVTRGSESAQHLFALCADADEVSSILLRRFAYALGDPDAENVAGGCVLIGPGTGPVRMLAFGAVVVTLADGEVVAASEYATWVERAVADPDGLTIAAVGQPWCEPPAGAGWMNLRDGVVPGGAVRLVAAVRGAPAGPDGPLGRHQGDSENGEQGPGPLPPAVPRAGAPDPPGKRDAPEQDGDASSRRGPSGPVAPSPSAVATVEHAVLPEPVEEPFESVLLTEEPGSVGAPLPVAAEREPSPDEVLVEGVVCSRGHFNDPGSGYCGVCGISMVQRTQEFVSAPRPALGVLIFDDGAVFSVDGDYVVGREPDLDAEVAGGRARPLVLNDEANAISRVHAALRLDGWRTLLQDRGSANGTFVSEPDDAESWRRLEQSSSVELRPGQHVRFGQRVAVFESHVRRR